MKKTTICNHCGSEYTPRRRGVQKFCSNSCRSRSWLLKQNKTKPHKTTLEQNKIQVPTVQSTPKKETISLTGAANAALGAAAVDLAKYVFTPEDNKNATKRDIKELKSVIKGQRYFEVKNIPKDNNGKMAYYDIDTGFMVYL
ncbi:hypothetical protein L3X39_00155 [Sabulilitoribacter multivorans]|uniref:Uncharacterized protein n=1 Tax=Flaviramulus multivorans TaxID=1304750 RepID=A0ABS9IE17_9FLAO|nr:hypothetical protein [Flaviramulus multivorans]MCF7559032.1 hypothetical protein [Flaviramulus multivorans]